MWSHKYLLLHMSGTVSRLSADETYTDRIVSNTGQGRISDQLNPPRRSSSQPRSAPRLTTTNQSAVTPSVQPGPVYSSPTDLARNENDVPPAYSAVVLPR